VSDVPPALLATAMPAGWQTAFTVAMVVPTVALIVVAARHKARNRDPVPLLCLVGGAFACLVEPLVDVLAHCWYPTHRQWKLMTVMGRDTPILVLPGYIWFMGGFAALTYIALQRGAMPRDVRRLYAALIAVNALVEIPGVHTHVYFYYGHQPLRIFDWPLWWGFVNTAIGIVGGCLVHAVRRRQLAAPSEALAIIALVPMIDAAVNAGAAWPLFSSLASPGWSVAANQIAGLLTCVLATVAVVVASELAAAADPGSLRLVAERSDVVPTRPPAPA
jgi:lipoprotein signal peptidase